MFLRLVLRILRIFVLVAIILAAWVTWWLTAQQPLREMRVSFSPTQDIAWSYPTLNDERVMLMAYGAATGKGGRFSAVEKTVEVDFHEGRVTELGQGSDGVQTGPKLEWAAWQSKDGVIHVACPPSSKSQFTVPLKPAGQDSVRRAFASCTRSPRLLPLDRPDGKTEIWDLLTQKVLCEIEGVKGQIAIAENNTLIAAFTDATTVGVWA
jgi:hypothetical protein